MPTLPWTPSGTLNMLSRFSFFDPAGPRGRFQKWSSTCVHATCVATRSTRTFARNKTFPCIRLALLSGIHRLEAVLALEALLQLFLPRPGLLVICTVSSRKRSKMAFAHAGKNTSYGTARASAPVGLNSSHAGISCTSASASTWRRLGADTPATVCEGRLSAAANYDKCQNACARRRRAAPLYPGPSLAAVCGRSRTALLSTSSCEPYPSNCTMKLPPTLIPLTAQSYLRQE